MGSVQQELSENSDFDSDSYKMLSVDRLQEAIENINLGSRMMQGLLQEKIEKNPNNTQEQDQDEYLVVVALDDPRDIITSHKYQNFQQTVNLEIDKIQKDDDLPKIKSMILLETENIIKISCTDQRSQKWFCATIPGICFPSGIKFDVRKTMESQYTIVIAHVTGTPKDSDIVMTRLQRFNPEVNIEKWRIIEVVASSNSDMILHIKINHESLEHLGKCNYKLRAGISLVTFFKVQANTVISFFANEARINFRRPITYSEIF